MNLQELLGTLSESRPEPTRVVPLTERVTDLQDRARRFFHAEPFAVGDVVYQKPGMEMYNWDSEPTIVTAILDEGVPCAEVANVIKTMTVGVIKNGTFMEVSVDSRRFTHTVHPGAEPKIPEDQNQSAPEEATH